MSDVEPARTANLAKGVLRAGEYHSTSTMDIRSSSNSAVFESKI